MSTKILIKENVAVSNEIIANERSAANNGKTLLSMLDKLGLTLDTVSDWGAIEQEFTKDYPKASLTFNLQANGIETAYRNAEAFYLKNRHALRFTAVTDGEIESIKESQRVYAAGSQIEAIELCNKIKDSLLKLKELGVPINLNKTYLVSKVLIGDERLQDPLVIDPKTLYQDLINLK